MKKILIYGDSNTWGDNFLTGERIPEEKQWVNILRIKYKNKYQFFQEGLPGRIAGNEETIKTYKNGKDTFISTFRTNAPVDKVIIAFGTNDLQVKYQKTTDKIIEDLLWYKKQIEETQTVENNNFKVGTYTLQYGKYRACFNSSNCREFTLNSDGTAIFDGTKKYFRVENYNFGQGVEDVLHPAIVFSDTEGGSPGPNVYTPYVSTPDCLMTDGEIEFVNYIGE